MWRVLEWLVFMGGRVARILWTPVEVVRLQLIAWADPTGEALQLELVRRETRRLNSLSAVQEAESRILAEAVARAENVPVEQVLAETRAQAEKALEDQRRNHSK